MDFPGSSGALSDHEAVEQELRERSGNLEIPGFLDRRQQSEKTNFSLDSFMSEDDKLYAAGGGFK